MKKIAYILSLLIFLTGASVFAQEDDNWVHGKTIVDVEFEGLNNVDKSELSGVVEPYIGEAFTDELFLELQTIMYELDYFEFIVPNAKRSEDNDQAVIIVFQVQESPSISKIVFNGNDSIWNTTLFNAIVVKAKDIYSDYKIENAKEQIITTYYEKGYDNTEVEIEKESNPEKNSLVITFNITEGSQTLIQEINFHGNNIFATDNKLRSLVETKKKTLFKDGVYKEDIIQGDILLIEGLYHDSGYINAKVLDIKTVLEDDEKKENVKNMVIDFFIEEGEQYTYGGITYQGNEVYTAADFDVFEFLKFGHVYNKSTHENRFLKIQSLYYDNGYIENGFHDQVNTDDENKIISHEITIVERSIAHIGSISVTGNKKTKDIVILREIQIESGEVFSRQKVWDAMSNIMSTSLFTAAVPQLNKMDNGDMQLVFEVEEAQTLTLMGGITVSGADFEPALSLSIKDSNFMGMGRTFGGSLNLGLISQSFTLQYSEPRILNTEFFSGGSLSFTHSMEDVLQMNPDLDSEGEEYPILTGVTTAEEYDEWLDAGNEVDEDEEDLHTLDISLAISGGHLWYTDVGRVRASTGYTTSMDTLLYDDKIDLYEEENQREPETWMFTDKVWVRGVLDNRNVPIGTTEGYGVSQSLSIGGIIPIENEDSHYIKSVSNVDFYQKLMDLPVNEAWNFLVSLRAHAAYTRIFEKPGYDLIEADKTARIDGMFVGRGWSSENYGTALLDLKLELIIPIVPSMVGATLFFDAANVWTEGESETDFDLDDFKFSFGGSLGITNQIMPISFFIAKTFQTDDGDIKWSPETEYHKLFDGNATWGISFNMNYLLN